MVVRATVDIAAGEDITHTYVDPLEPLLVRQLYRIYEYACRCGGS